MNWFQSTIRSSLRAVVRMLCAPVVGLTSVEVFGAWEQMGRAARVADSNRIADLLLTSAGNWAVERGVVNAALAAPDLVDSSPLQEGSTGTEEVARNAAGLNAASRETGAAPNWIPDVARGLSRHTRELSRKFDVFIARVRAA